MRLLGRLLLPLVLLLFSMDSGLALAARSDSVSYPLVSRLSLESGVDYVAPSTRDEIRGEIPPEKKVNVNTAIPVSLKYSFSFTDPHISHFLKGGYQGVSLGILNLGGAQPHGADKANRNIGYPVLAYVFQGGPFWHIRPGLSMNYEWNFGASFGWKPYSDFNKYFDLAVGSKVNAYLNLNFSLQWQLNPHLGLMAGVAVSHFSNGNTSFPNPGINSFGLRVGLNYILNPIEKVPTNILAQGVKKERQPDTIKRKRRVDYDVSVWASTRKRVYRGGDEPVLLKGHFACAGIGFAPMVKLNQWWKVGGSLDLQWDQSSDLKKNYISGDTTEDIKFSKPDFWRQVTVGLSAHGELRMPIFAVNVGIGYNLVAPWENRGSYQNITLKTYVCPFLYLNVGYQLRNFYQQSSLMLGLGVTV